MITALTLLTDDEVVQRVRGGQIDAYEILIRRYNQRLFRLVYPILGDRFESEDVIQETHLRALTHLDQFAGRSKFATWLGRISIYEALGRLRNRRRFETTNIPSDNNWPETTASGSLDPEKQAMKTQLGDVLDSSVKGLPIAYRSVLVARLIEDMSTSETCARLRLTEEAVKTRLHRAKAMLRKDLAGRLAKAS